MSLAPGQTWRWAVGYRSTSESVLLVLAPGPNEGSFECLTLHDTHHDCPVKLVDVWDVSIGLWERIA